VSAIDSPRPICSSVGDSATGVAPSRAIAVANEKRVRVDGFSKMQAIVSPRSVSATWLESLFSSSASSSNAANVSGVRSLTRVKS
jgi:hypothetical protein